MLGYWCRWVHCIIILLTFCVQHIATQRRRGTIFLLVKMCKSFDERKEKTKLESNNFAQLLFTRLIPRKNLQSWRQFPVPATNKYTRTRGGATSPSAKRNRTNVFVRSETVIWTGDTDTLCMGTNFSVARKTNFRIQRSKWKIVVSVWQQQSKHILISNLVEISSCHSLESCVNGNEERRSRWTNI